MLPWVLCFLCTHREDCGFLHKKRYRTGRGRSHVKCRRVSEHDCAGREERRLPQPAPFRVRLPGAGTEVRLLRTGRATRIMQVYSDSKRRPVVLGLTHAAEQLLRIHRRFTSFRYTASNKASGEGGYDGSRSISRARAASTGSLHLSPSGTGAYLCLHVTEWKR